MRQGSVDTTLVCLLGQKQPGSLGIETVAELEKTGFLQMILFLFAVSFPYPGIFSVL
jgi:hypothetical protein